jgi:hypothetical protein
MAARMTPISDKALRAAIREAIEKREWASAARQLRAFYTDAEKGRRRQTRAALLADVFLLCDLLERAADNGLGGA